MADGQTKDLEYLLSLEGSVLLDIDPYLLVEEDGAIVVTCPDGRYFSDIFSHHSRMQQNYREYPLIHPFGMNGGALLLAPDSPLVSPGSTIQADLLRGIIEAMEWIKIRKVVLSAHYRCGKASNCGVGATETIRLLFAAKKAVKTWLERYGPVVSCYFHIDFGIDFKERGKKKRVLSYYANREGWENLKGIAQP